MQVARHSSGCWSRCCHARFCTQLAAVGIPYGSIHTQVVDGVKKSFLPVAPTFEHMVFGEAGSEAHCSSNSVNSARANALTGYCDTVYFVTIENVERCLQLLLVR